MDAVIEMLSAYQEEQARRRRRKLTKEATNMVEERRGQERVVREDSSKGRVRAVLKFDKRLPNVSGILGKNWKTMVEDDTRLLAAFPKPPMVCYSRDKNIREELCQAKLPPVRSNMATRQGDAVEGFRRCGKSGCRLCPYTGQTAKGKITKSVK